MERSRMYVMTSYPSWTNHTYMSVFWRANGSYPLFNELYVQRTRWWSHVSHFENLRLGKYWMVRSLYFIYESLYSNLFRESVTYSWIASERNCCQARIHEDIYDTIRCAECVDPNKEQHRRRGSKCFLWGKTRYLSPDPSPVISNPTSLIPAPSLVRTRREAIDDRCFESQIIFPFYRICLYFCFDLHCIAG